MAKKDSAKKSGKSKQAGKGKSAAEAAERPMVIEPLARFGDWLEEWPAVFSRRLPDLFARGSLDVEPIRVEQFSDGSDTVIRAEIPGVDPDEDIEISVAGGQLAISAKREQREESKTDKGFRSEFRYGSFRRGIALPPGTEAADVEATYEDGILEVRFPMDAEVEAETKVPVQRKE